MMSQKGGADYLVLYQMLCFMAAGNNGELFQKVGDMIIPFDAEKIQRETKWFSLDTVRVALELYKRLGMVYEEENGILKIMGIDDILYSETANAQVMRDRRKAMETIKKVSGDSEIHNNVNNNVITMLSQSYNNVKKSTSEEGNIVREPNNQSHRYNIYNNNTNTDKDNTKYKDTDKNTDKDKNKERILLKDCVKDECAEKPTIKKFVPPTLEEVTAYSNERHNNLFFNPTQFINFYESKGWFVGKNKMKDWKAAVRTWEVKAGFNFDDTMDKIKEVGFDFTSQQKTEKENEAKEDKPIDLEGLDNGL